MARLTKNHIKTVGDTLINDQSSEAAREEALADLSRWREAHLVPFQAMLEALERAARNAGADFVLFGRIKRIDTIEGKLRRPGRTHKLNTMNDIAGCRLILPSLEDVREVASLLWEELGPAAYDTHDYIADPQQSGYRGIHVIGKFDSPSFELKGLRVEAQIRTNTQHAWASTLELYDVLAESGLKFGCGSTKQLRFFQITSLLFAAEEEGSELLGSEALAEELKTLENDLHVIGHLEGANDSVVTLGDVDAVSLDSYCLIHIDYETQEAHIKAFPQTAARDAVMKYAEDEQCKRQSGRTDALMLKASSLDTLKRALPNYFSGVSPFLGLIAPHLR